MKQNKPTVCWFLFSLPLALAYFLAYAALPHARDHMYWPLSLLLPTTTGPFTSRSSTFLNSTYPHSKNCTPGLGMLANHECSRSPRYAHCTNVPPACDDITSAVVIQAGSTPSKAITAAPAIQTVAISTIQTLNHPRVSTVDAP